MLSDFLIFKIFVGPTTRRAIYSETRLVQKLIFIKIILGPPKLILAAPKIDFVVLTIVYLAPESNLRVPTFGQQTPIFGFPNLAWDWTKIKCGTPKFDFWIPKIYGGVPPLIFRCPKSRLEFHDRNQFSKFILWIPKNCWWSPDWFLNENN